MTDTTESIARENERRHDHYDESNVSRCKHCSSFVSKGTPENGQIRYRCNACGRAILEYVPQKQRQPTRP